MVLMRLALIVILRSVIVIDVKVDVLAADVVMDQDAGARSGDGSDEGRQRRWREPSERTSAAHRCVPRSTSWGVGRAPHALRVSGARWCD